jgi:type I restriction enzyme S subunit
VFTDGDWVESKDQDPEGEVRLIQLADVGNGTFIDKSARFLTEDKAEELKCTFLRKGDILVARMPDPLGRACIFPLDGSRRYVTVVDVCVVRPADDEVDVKYLMYALNSPMVRARIDDYKSGSTRKRISRGNLARIAIPIAPTLEQRRIVAKIEELFSELDNGIGNFQRAREQLQVYRQAVLKYAFQGRLTEQWRKDNEGEIKTAEQLVADLTQARKQRYDAALAEWEARPNGTKAKRPQKPDPVKPAEPDVQARLPQLPEGWCYVRVANLCDVVRGGSPRPAGDVRYYEGPIPFLKVADLTRTPGAYLDTHSYSIKEVGLTKTRLVEPPTLMLSNSGATLGVPKICRIKATFNDGIAAFLGIEEDALLYHYYFWASKTDELRGVDQGAAQPNLNTDLIGDVVIPICSPPEMQAVANEIERLLSKCEQVLTDIDEQLLKTAVLREAILRSAFSGQLVEQNQDDEPASVLLERIASKREQAEEENGVRRAARKKRIAT